MRENRTSDGTVPRARGGTVNTGNAVFTSTRAGGQERAPQEDRPGTRRQRSDDVHAVAHATIEVYLCAIGDGVHDRPKGVERGDRAIQLPPAMIGDPDGCGASLHGHQRVRHRQDPLDHERE